MCKANMIAGIGGDDPSPSPHPAFLRRSTSVVEILRYPSKSGCLSRSEHMVANIILRRSIHSSHSLSSSTASTEGVSSSTPSDAERDFSVGDEQKVSSRMEEKHSREVRRQRALRSGRTQVRSASEGGSSEVRSYSGG